MKLKHLAFLFLGVFIACNQQPAAVISENEADKADIGRAVSEYWAKARPELRIKGLSFQKYTDSIYLVGATFDGTTNYNAVNVVVRKFEEDGRSIWKAEAFNEHWARIIRLEPQ